MDSSTRQSRMTQQDEELFWTLANDAKTRKDMLLNAAKLGYKDHPSVKSELETEERLKAYVAPYKEQIDELKARLDSRELESKMERQRESVRRMGMSPANVEKLEERMHAKGVPLFADTDQKGRTAMQQAAIYFSNEDSPVAASTAPMMDFAMSGVNTQAEDWREDMLSPDPKVNPRLMDRRARKVYNDKKWDAAVADWNATHQK